MAHNGIHKVFSKRFFPQDPFRKLRASWWPHQGVARQKKVISCLFSFCFIKLYPFELEPLSSKMGQLQVDRGNKWCLRIQMLVVLGKQGNQWAHSQEGDFVQSRKKRPSEDVFPAEAAAPSFRSIFYLHSPPPSAGKLQAARVTPGYSWSMTVKSTAEVFCHRILERCYITFKGTPRLYFSFVVSTVVSRLPTHCFQPSETRLFHLLLAPDAIQLVGVKISPDYCAPLYLCLVT